MAVLFLCTLWSCYSYAIVLTLAAKDDGPSLPTDLEIQTVINAVAEVAKEFGLSPSDNLEEIQQLSQRDDWSLKVLARFGGDLRRDGQRHRILVSVRQHKQTGALSVLIRDWDATTESPLTEALRSSIASLLVAQLREGRIHVERKYDMPSFYMP